MQQAYEIYYFDVFYEQYALLISEVLKLRSKDPSGYKKHEKTKLLNQIKSVIRVQIATNPGDRQFHLGDTLPKEYRMYKRAKAGLPARYRLFFRYKSLDGKIVIIWMNDKYTIRRSGAKNDVYNVFSKMVENGTIPSNWKSLLNSSKVDELKASSN